MEVLIELIKRDPDTAVRVILAIVGGIAAYGIYLIIKRGNKDSEIIGRTLEREQHRADELEDDVTEQSKERWRLIAEKALLEGQLKECQERLAAKQASGLTVAEENVLREMIISLRDEVRIKDNHIARLKEEQKRNE